MLRKVLFLMKEKITYLLGAGASANILPLVKEVRGNPKAGLPSALEDFISKYKQEIVTSSRWSQSDFFELEKIVKKCKVFGTPDLAAKYYLETGDLKRYDLLKKTMSAFFYLKEESPDTTGNGFEGKSIDYRVVPFLTTILNKRKLPEDLRILSWNYDTQIERGAKMLHPILGVNDIQNFNVWPFKADDIIDDNKDYSLLHLNGVCGEIYSDAHFSLQNPYLYDFSRELETQLSFAWEDDESFKKELFTKRRLPIAKRMIEKTTILVVIGYSFPFFNRKVDAELFSIMKPTLKKIYFQDPYLGGDFLYNQFGLIKDNNALIEAPVGARVVDIVPVKNAEQYYVPFEL